MKPWKPKPGSVASRVIELLRFLPAGTSLNAVELRERLEIKEGGSLHIHLAKATRQGLLKPVKRDEGDAGLLTYWAAATSVRLAGL